jgi:hypothetical protein
MAVTKRSQKSHLRARQETLCDVLLTRRLHRVPTLELDKIGEISVSRVTESLPPVGESWIAENRCSNPGT